MRTRKENGLERGKIKGFKNCGENKCGRAAKRRGVGGGGVDTRGQTRSHNIKAKRKFPDKLTGVDLNECSFQPVVCRNHC